MGGIVAGLARVSTEDQAYRVALSNQVQRLREAGCDRVYYDVASRADDGRESMLQLIADIEAGEICEVKVTRVDRLTASPALFERLVKLMQERLIPLTGLDEHIDIFNEDSEFFAGLGVYIAKRELQTIRKRSQKGHESRRNNDRANVVLPWGYTTINRRYKLDDKPFLCLLSDRPIDGSEDAGLSRADMARDMITLFFEGQSLSRAVILIHKKYGVQKFSSPKPSKNKGSNTSGIVSSDDEFELTRSHRQTRRGAFQWTHKGLRNWLLNPILRGHTAYGTRELKGLDSAGRRVYGKTLPQEKWDIRESTHPDQALLTETQVQEIKRRLRYNGQTRCKSLMESHDRRHPVSGLLRCDVCKGAMKSQASKFRDGDWRNYYKCKNSIVGRCDQSKSIRNDRAEAAIIEALTHAAERIDALRQSPEPILEPLALLELREQLDSLKTMKSSPIVDRAIVETEEQIKRQEFNFRQASLARIERQDSAVEILREPGFWDSCDSDERMRLFHWLVNDVWIKDGEVVRRDNGELSIDLTI
jgi:site-specific DNA recombinase